MWDVGGQSIASAMLNKYFFDANAVLFVYDITNTASFDNVSEWIDAVKKLLKTTDKVGGSFLTSKINREQLPQKQEHAHPSWFFKHANSWKMICDKIDFFIMAFDF